MLNHDFYYNCLARRIGGKFEPTFLADTLADAIGYYDEAYIDRLKGGLVQAAPRRGSQEAVEAAHRLGLTVVLATNPVFSLEVDLTRMQWGELDPADFSLITHWENCRRTKPDARYYQELTNSMGLLPQECLMVGNDAGMDFPRPSIGMPTAYVGHGRPKRSVFRGGMRELAQRLPELVESLNFADAQADDSA